MNREVSAIMAFAAGLLSFLSPCVLPLIPSYFSILAGMGFDSLPASAVRSRLLKTAATFVLGFSAVFTLLGILVNAAFLVIAGILPFITIAAGIIVIVLGLNIVFDFFSFLNYEKRPFLSRGIFSGPAKPFAPGGASSVPEKKGPLAGAPAFLAGMAFAAGWTPCVGPILTGILLMASQTGKTAAAVLYLALYSAGMALPFIFAALFFDFFMKRIRRFRKGLSVIRYLSGAVLVIIGVMILLGKYSALNGQIQTLVLRYIDWAEDKTFPLNAAARFLAWLGSF